MRKATVALSSLLTLSVAGNVYLYNQWSQKVDERTYYPGDKPLIDKAVALFGSEVPHPSNEQTQREMRHRFPIASRIPDPSKSGHFLLCVTLKAREGMLAFTPVYCFDEQGKLVSRALF